MAFKNCSKLMKFFNIPVLGICLDVDLFVLVPASVSNRSLNTRSVTKQKLPKYQGLKRSTNHIESHKKINSNLFAVGVSLVNKILSCPPINLSNSQTLILDSVETGVLLSDFAQQRRHNQTDVPDI